MLVEILWFKAGGRPAGPGTLLLEVATKAMNWQRSAIVLTVVNLGLLIFLVLSMLERGQAGAAVTTPQVLRGHALEIVDGQGRVRASIKVQPATGAYPETVMFRLIDAAGRPEVKIGGSAHGGGIGLVGDNDATQVLLQADKTVPTLRLKNRKGKELLLRP